MTTNTMRRIVLAGVLAGALLVTSGCGIVVAKRRLPGRSEQRTVELENAKSLRAELRIGVGTLAVSAGDTGSVDADFEYGNRAWRPEVEYDVRDDEGDLRVTQPADMSVGLGESRNDWDIRFPGDLPLDLDVNLGVGETTLELGELQLRRLSVTAGTGDATIDLSGLTDDCDATIEAGVGEVVLKVPSGIGVRVIGRVDGVGDYDAPDLHGDGDALVNDEYGRSDKTLDIVLRRGVGDVRIESVPSSGSDE